MSKSKWHEIKKQSETPEKNYQNSPVDTQEENQLQFLNTQVGSPVNTTEKLDAQQNNLSPIDTQTEIKKLNDDLDPPYQPRP